LESRQVAHERLAVVGADVLADVAAEDVAAHGSAEVLRDGAAELDGEVGDAAAGVEEVGLDQGFSGAGVEAEGAGAAAVGLGRGGFEFQVGDEQPEEKEKWEMLDRIQINARRIVGLVTGCLEASKAEAGKLDIAPLPISVNRLLSEAARQQESDVRTRGLTLELKLDEQLPDVPGDESQLDRVFWNLFSNAIKFTPKGGRIVVSSGRENDYICVSVQDTGTGIREDKISLLFSQFQRLEGPTKIEGTGLGLFIVKTIVEAHHGNVQVKSGAGQGSTFTARLPIHPKTRAA